MNNNLSISSVSDLLMESGNITSFTALESFPRIVENVSQKEKKEKAYINMNNMVNNTDIYKIIEKLKESNKLGRLFIEEINENEIDLFIAGNHSESTNFKIIKSPIDEVSYSINMVHLDKEQKGSLLITSDNSEFLLNMFSVVFGHNMEKEYTEFIKNNILNSYIDLDNLDTEHNNNEYSSEELNNDSIYDILSNIGIQSQNKIFVDNIGVFFTQNKIWRVVGSDIDIHDDEELYKVLISLKKNNNANYINYSNIEEDLLLLKNKYSDLVEKIKKEKIKAAEKAVEEEINLKNEKLSESSKNTSISDEEKKEKEEHIVYEENVNYIENNNDIDYINMEINSSQNYDEYNSEFIDVGYYEENNNFNSNLENTDIINKKNKVGKIMSNSEIEDEIKINEKQIDNNKNEIYNNKNIKEKYNENGITMINQLNQLNNKFSIEDFLYCTINNNFQLKPEISIHNDNDFFRIKKYVFKNKKSDNEENLVFSISGNQWYLNNNKKNGSGLTSFITELYSQVSVEFNDNRAKVFVNFINKNKNELEEISNNRNKLNEFISNKINENAIDNSTGEENIFKLSSILEKYGKNYPFILDIDSIDIVERNNKKNQELISLGKTYRLNGMDWYCIEDRKIGVGIKELINYIYSEKNDEFKAKKLNSYKYMIKSELEKLFLDTKNDISGLINDDKKNKVITKNNTDTNVSTDNNNNNNNNKEKENIDVKKSISAMQLAKVDKEEIKNNFNELVDIHVNDILSKDNILNVFSMNKIIEESLNNKAPYKMSKSDNGDIICGKIIIKENMNITDLINNICDTYNLDKNTETLRVSNVLTKLLKEKVKNELKSNIEKHEENLIQSKLDEISDIEQTNNNNNEEVINKTREEEFEDLIGLSRAELSKPIKKNLYSYYSVIDGQLIDFNIQHLFKSMERINPILKEIKINQETFGEHSSFILEANAFKIKINMSSYSEDWEIISANDKRNLKDSGDSVVDLIEQLNEYYSINLDTFSFNKNIGRLKERNFLTNFSKEELLEKVGAVKNGSSYQFNSLKIGIADNKNGKTIYSIWNRNVASRISTIELMQYILAEQNGIDVTNKELMDKNEKTSWFVAKNELKNIYLSMDSYQRNTLNNKSSNSYTMSADEKFKIMLPKPNINSDQMRNYLINERGINPEMVDELDGNYIYEGLYDVDKKSLFNNRNNEDEEQLVPVVVFANDNCASVRGCTSIGSKVKETVPGSSLSVLYSIPESKKYNYKDAKKEINLVFNEAPIDSLSYRSLYPKSRTFSLFGLNTNLMIEAMQEMHKIDDSVRIVYALDNTELDDNGIPYDKGSRTTLFNVMNKMSDHCYLEFKKIYTEKTENNNLINSELTNDILNIFENEIKLNESQLDQVGKTILSLLENNKDKTITINSNELKKDIGKLLFKFSFIDSNRFIVKTPKHEKYGVFKDWNEMLVKIVEIKQNENKNKNLIDIHEEIISEFNPDLIKKTLKKENKNQMKLI